MQNLNSGSKTTKNIIPNIIKYMNKHHTEHNMTERTRMKYT